MGHFSYNSSGDHQIMDEEDLIETKHKPIEGKYIYKNKDSIRLANTKRIYEGAMYPQRHGIFSGHGVSASFSGGLSTMKLKQDIFLNRVNVVQLIREATNTRQELGMALAALHCYTLCNF